MCKEALWTLSNLCAGTELQTCQVITWNRYEGLHILLEYATNPKVSLTGRREAAWAIINTFHENPKFEALLSRFSIISRLCDYCYCQMAADGPHLDSQVTCILTMLEQHLKRDEEREEIANVISFLSVFVPDEKVAKNVARLISLYFPQRWTHVDTLD